MSNSRKAIVDIFVRKGSTSNKKYVQIRAVSARATQFIEIKFLSNVLDDKIVEKVKTFRNEEMETKEMVALVPSSLFIIEMLSTRLLALDNKEKIKKIESRLDTLEYFKEDVPVADEEVLRNLYGTGKKGMKRKRTKQDLRERDASAATEPTKQQRFPKRAAKKGRRQFLKY